MLAVASSIPMHSVPGGRYFHPLPIPTLHCIFIPSATSARKARVRRTLAFVLNKTILQIHAFAPLPHSAYPNHSAKSTIHFFVKIEPHIYPKNKKESKGKWLAIGLQG
jgi:hypothetical protein